MKGFLLELVVSVGAYFGYHYRTGKVRGVRVEAPAILMRGGLSGRIHGVVGGIRFPPSNGSQVVSYPFSLS